MKEYIKCPECPLCGMQVTADAESRNKYCGECG